MRFLIFGLFFCSNGLLFSQKLQKFWVEFSDKNDSPFSIHRPAEFLSARSLDRRATAGISIDETDLPVNQTYLNSLKINGLVIHCTSHWLNAAAVIGTAEQADLLKKLPFVKAVTYVGPHLKAKNPPVRKVRKWQGGQPPNLEKSYFGYSGYELSLMNEYWLHFLGKTGQGKVIAVQDGGFINVDTLPFFDSLVVQNRLFQGRDFVENDGSVFEQASHGTAVLSVMASDLPNFFIGAAPSATYICSKTEDTGGEFPIEEINWIAGAEFADSLGADVLNASLGYTTFNDNSLSHSYLDLDGRTAIGSRGAAIAAQKGMIICNSAGNEGDGEWHFIGVPADAPNVIAVGATDLLRKKASFSSFGPTADGRIKPDLVAPGEDIIAAGVRGFDLTRQNGTSLASPLLAGSLAALWSAFPEKSAAEIMDAVFKTASQSKRPDNRLGWGLPDFLKAWVLLADFSWPSVEIGRAFLTKKLENAVVVQSLEPISERHSQVILTDIFGRKINSGSLDWSNEILPSAEIEGIAPSRAGFYFLQMVGEENVHNSFIINVK